MNPESVENVGYYYIDIFGIQTFIYLDTLYSSSTEEMLYILLGRVQNLTTNCPDIEDDVYICDKYLRDTARIFFSQDD